MPLHAPAYTATIDLLPGHSSIGSSVSETLTRLIAISGWTITRTSAEGGRTVLRHDWSPVVRITMVANSGRPADRWRPLRRWSVAVLQQATDPLTRHDALAASHLATNGQDQLIAQALMVSFTVIMLDELTDRAPERAF